MRRKFILQYLFGGLVYPFVQTISLCEKSGGGPPQSKTLARLQEGKASAKRLGLRQPSGALERRMATVSVDRRRR